MYHWGYTGKIVTRTEAIVHALASTGYICLASLSPIDAILDPLVDF